MSSKKINFTQNNFEQLTTAQRIVWLADYCKLNGIKGIKTNKDFLQTAELSLTYISDLKSGKVKNPSSGAIGNIALHIGARLPWIHFGKGKPFAEGPVTIDQSTSQMESELHERIVKYSNSKAGEDAGRPARQLLLAFRDQLRSQQVQDQSRLEQTNAMIRMLDWILGNSDEVNQNDD